MSTTFKRKLSIGLFIYFALLVFFTPLYVQADFLNKDKREEYDGNLAMITTKAGISTERSLDQIIGNGIRVVLASVGTIFIVMMVLAGNEWMRAAGNKETIQKAQKKISSLVIGLLLTLSAYVLSYWIASILAKVLVN